VLTETGDANGTSSFADERAKELAMVEVNCSIDNKDDCEACGS